MTESSRRSAVEDILDDELSHRVIGCAITVHRVLGCGVLEAAYEKCLAHELTKAGCSLARQVLLPIIYDGIRVDAGYKVDLIVNGELIIELKTVTHLLPVHEAQVLTYLRFSGIARGLLMNFHAQPLAKGIRRIVLSPQFRKSAPARPITGAGRP